MKLSNKEQMILNILSSKESIDINEIIDKTTFSYLTVMNILYRMVGKGVSIRADIKNSYVRKVSIAS